MRNLKKFLALVLAMLMVVGAAATVSAFDDVEASSNYAAAIDELVGYGIVKGTSETEFSPEENVQRFQMAIFMARSLRPNVTDAEWNTSVPVFADVTEWGNAIAFAKSQGIINGIGDNLFAPSAGIEYQDALLMAIRALGYKVSTSVEPYWIDAFYKAQELGLTKNITGAAVGQTLNRAQCAQIIYNMLYATPADGSDPIVVKNFTAAAKDVTSFVITATQKQGEKLDESYKGYVGLQRLENGLPTGEIITVPVSALGLTEENVDFYFGRVYNFVDYKASTGSYTRVEAAGSVESVLNADVTVDGTTKIKVDGKTYYVVDKLTGDPIRNEIVIYNGGTSESETKELAVDKDGNVYNDEGEKVATFMYTVGGVNRYKDIESGKVLTEKEALELYGQTVSTSIDYATVKADALKDKHYQINLYDDDNNGIYDRATFTPVYLGTYVPAAKDKEVSYGPMKAAKAKNVTYVSADNNEAIELEKGQVITYTWNKDTNTVAVLSIVDVESGKVTRVNTSDIGKGIVKVTIDGKVYTVATEDLANAGKIGGAVYGTANEIDGTTAFEKIAKGELQIGFTPFDTLGLGNVDFYAIGDYVVAIAPQKGAPKDDTKYPAYVKEVKDITANNKYFIADLYINGVIVKDAQIASYKIGDTTTKPNGTSIAAIARSLEKAQTEIGSKLVEYKKDADGYYTVTVKEISWIADKDVLDAYEEDATSIKFKDGIGDQAGKAVDFADGTLLTDEKTVFYFIKGTTVTAVVGAKDGKAIDLTVVESIYADKLGIKDAADIVIVTVKNEEGVDKTAGFNKKEEVKPTFNTIYVNKFDSTKFEQVYTGKGEGEVDLAGIDAGKVVYVYTIEGVDLTNGTAVTKIYSQKKLSDEFKKGDYIAVNTNGVYDGKGEAATISTMSGVNGDDFISFRGKWVDSDGNNIGGKEVTKIVISTDGKSVKTDADAKKALATDNTYDISFVITGKTLVGIATKN